MNSEPDEAHEQLQKQRLLKAARMYAMCQKAEVGEPHLLVSLALAAFEEMPLPDASEFVKTNLANLEDMAWALRNAESSEDFESKLREKISTKRRGRTRGNQRFSPGSTR